VHNLYSKLAHIEALCQTVFAAKITPQGNLHRYPRLPKMPDCQVIALSLAATLEGIHSENSLFARLHNDNSALLTHLPSRQRYNQRAKRLREWCDELACHLSDEMMTPDEALIVDSTPLPICRQARARRLKICREDTSLLPTQGYIAIDKNYFMGYRLHLATTERGVVENFFLAPGNQTDITNLVPLTHSFRDNSTVLGDKGYISRPIQLDLFEERNIKLITPTRRNQRGPTSWTKTLARKRRRIETCFAQLIDQFALRLNYAKTSLALASRIAYKICAMTLAQFNNFTSGRPLAQIKNAPIFQ
jgi:IS5 family transposase